MSKPIRVLIVEDSENDALLLAREFRRGGFAPEIERVDTPETMTAALADQKWDLVISDYAMPHFTGLAALSILKESGLDLPFIIVSGAIGEDIAVEAMKAGAHDYLMKGNLQRLIPSVERELREAEVRCQGRRAAEEVKQADAARQQHLQEIQFLHEIGQAIINSDNLDTVLEKILEKTLVIGPSDLGVIRLLDPASMMLKPVISRGYRNPENIRALSPNPADSGFGKLQYQVFTGVGACVIENLATVPGSRTFKKEGVESAIFVPVRADREIIGTMQLGSRTPRKFAAGEIRLLETIGHQLGIALQKSNLHAATQQAHKELKSLYAVTATVSRTLDQEIVLNEVIQKVTEIFGFDAMRIFLFDPSRQTLWLKASYEARPELFAGITSWRLGQGIVGKTAERGEPIVFDDARNDPKYLALSYGARAGVVGFRFFAAFPIKSKQQTLGVMALFENRPRSLTANEIALLTAMAEQLGTAVENTRVFEETAHRADELTLKTLELEKAIKVKDEFLSVMSHELRTPLNVMMGYLTLLWDGMYGGLSQEQVRVLRTVMAQSRELLSIINGLLQVTQIECGESPVTRTAVHVSELLDELRTAGDLPTKKHLLANWDYPFDLPSVQTDGGKLKQILHNLLSNAFKFTTEGAVTISARHMAEAKTMVFKVADTGAGIAKELLPTLFAKFHQGDSSSTRSFGGVGLGLYIVKNYTEMLGGEIEVESDLGRGSTFTVTIPCKTAGHVAWPDQRLEQTP